jgi:hypothetical protein
MKLFIFLIFIAAFLQTSFIPLNLCLLLLICRSYTIHEAANYYLALTAGILLGILTSLNSGFYSLIFIGAVFLIHAVRLLPISGRFITVIPVTWVILIAVMAIESFFYHLPFKIWLPTLTSVLALPVYLIIREWEDRFVAKPGIKLKM